MKSKEKRIEKEIDRLKDILSMLDEEKINAAEGLVSEASFMRITLEDLKDTINKEGTVDIMPQGEYSIKRQSPEVQTYNAMIQRYNTTYKELLNLLPKEIASDVDDDFTDF